jgi:hypothetical protein
MVTPGVSARSGCGIVARDNSINPAASFCTASSAEDKYAVHYIYVFLNVNAIPVFSAVLIRVPFTGGYAMNLLPALLPFALT